MQQKPKYSRPAILFMALIGMSVGVVTVLMFRDIAIPQHQIEKELDAKAFTHSSEQ